MRATRLILTAATAAALALSAGCSATEDPAAESSSSAAPSSSTPSSASSSAPEEEDSSSSSEPAASTVLMATTGTEDDPAAFEIALTDADGEPVTSVPAGDYTIEVQDFSKIHNFHLTGDGVDESTTVPETGATTWQVSLEPGEYEYVCDPHVSSMSGTLTVT